MRAISLALLFMLVAVESSAEPATLDEWIAIAEVENPGLIAAGARADAAGHSADGAGSWSGPVIGYGWFLEPVQTRVGPQQHKLSITQGLPVFGRNGLRSEAASATLSVEENRREFLRYELRYRLVRSWNELWMLDESVRIARSDLDLIEALYGSSLGQYRAGRTPQASVVRIELERERAADELRRIEGARGPLLARINAELGRDPGAPLDGGSALATSVVPPLDSLRTRLHDNSSLVAAAHRTDAVRSRAQLASRDQWPTLAVGADWIITGDVETPGVEGSGRDAILLRAAVRLPWPSGGRSAEAGRQEALVVAARADETQLGLNLGADLEQAWFDFSEAERRIELLEESLVPSADLALSVTRSSFAAGESSVGDLIEIRRTRLDLALEFARVSADRANHIARLEFLVNSRFSSVEED